MNGRPELPENPSKQATIPVKVVRNKIFSTPSKQMAANAFKNVQFPGGGRGLLGSAGALLGLGTAAYGVNASLFNGTFVEMAIFADIVLLLLFPLALSLLAGTD